MLHTALQICACDEGLLIGNLEHQPYIHGIHAGGSDGLHAQIGVFVGSAF